MSRVESKREREREEAIGVTKWIRQNYLVQRKSVRFY